MFFSAFDITVAPKISGRFDKPIVAKVGESFRIEVPFTGIPSPMATWSMNGRPLVPSGHIKIDTTNRSSTLTIKHCEKSDAGQYSMTLKNPAGSDSINVDVQVFDRPGPPRGPLEMSNISENSVTLSWSPPSDDGGSRIFTYLVQKRGELETKWKPVNKEHITDLTFKVSGLKENKKYQFRVLAQNQIGVSKPLEGQSVTPQGQYSKLLLFFLFFFIQEFVL